VRGSPVLRINGIPFRREWLFNMNLLLRSVMFACFFGAALNSIPARSDALDIPAYQRVLKSHVDEYGQVDYQSLKAGPQNLEAFLDSVAALSPAAYEAWSKSEKIAFWINVYNASTLKVIVDHYPIRSSFFRSLTLPKNSIRQISGAWSKIAFTVMGRKLTLDHIEHSILRRQYDEPGIHMALVCAARSCPWLRQEPYSGSRLQDQLIDQARNFLSQPQNFVLDQGRKEILVSSIFKWYKQDYVPRSGPEIAILGLNPEESAVMAYISRFLPAGSALYLQQGNCKVKYREYDWTLNERQKK